MLFSGNASDAMAHVAALLPWKDVAATTRCCRASRDAESSAFYRAWAARSKLVLPPDVAVSRMILSTLTDITSVTLPPNWWVERLQADNVLAPRLPRVRCLMLDYGRFDVRKWVPLDLARLAQVFPSTTHLTILRPKDVSDMADLRAFRCLQYLNVSVGSFDFARLISGADLPTLEVLELKDFDLPALKFVQGMTNLRTLKLPDIQRIEDMSSLRNLFKLTELSLKSAVVTRTAVRDLLEIAPRLTCFKCASVEPFWGEGETEFVDGVGAEQLARAFKKLETLVIKEAHMQDLSSIALVGSLSELRLTLSPRVNISPLQKLVQLEQLHITSYAAIDLAPLATLPKLVSLRSDHCGDDYPGHREAASFRPLQIFSGSGNDMWWMKDLHNLHTLTIFTQPGEVLQLPQTPLPGVRVLDITQDTDVSVLNLRFPHLRHLWLTSGHRNHLHPSMTDVFTHVARLTELESLYVGSTYDQVEFEQLACLPNLRKIMLLKCHTKTLNGIDTLSSLRELEMGFENDPTLDLSPLERLPCLQELRLSICTIADATPLTRIPSLRVVELRGTADLHPLVVAYHAARLQLPGAPASLELQKVLHGKENFSSDNCLWGKHISDRVQLQLREMAYPPARRRSIPPRRASSRGRYGTRNSSRHRRAIGH